VAPYADKAYQFDATQRATQAVIQGAGCSTCGSGLGTYGYGYQRSGFPNGNNNWLTKSTESLPDGSTQTVYTNFVGQVLLTDFQDVASGNHYVIGSGPDISCTGFQGISHQSIYVSSHSENSIE
jgi:hypothetical protein